MTLHEHWEKIESETFKFDNGGLDSSKDVLLGTTIDNSLTFDSHIKDICLKSGRKPNTLSKISPYLGINKKELLFKRMVKSQFWFCPEVWIFCSRNSTNLISQNPKKVTNINCH